MKIYENLLNLNLFESDSEDSIVIRKQVLSTRLFLVSIILSMIGFSIYGSLSLRTVSVVEQAPTQSRFNQLSQRYKSTIQCSCSRIGIAYGEFINYASKQHEICESVFSSQIWINAVYKSIDSTVPFNDLRRTLSQFSQSLRFVCELTSRIQSQCLDSFKSKLFFSRYVQTKDFLEKNVETEIRFSFKQSVAALRRTLIIAERSIVGNHLVSGLGSNFQFYSKSNETIETHLALIPNKNEECDCFHIDGCTMNSILATKNNLEIPGFIYNCQPFVGFLESSLFCFYDSNCLSTVQDELSIKVSNVKPLIQNSRFDRNVTIRNLIEQLFIEDFNQTVSFENYFHFCNPSSCSYSYRERFNIPFLTSVLFTAFGALNLVLKFVSPLLIDLYFRRESKKIKFQLTKILQAVRKLKHVIINLNLFKTNSRDEATLYRQRLSTRTFLVFLFFCLTVFSISTYFSYETKFKSVSQPTIKDFDNLYENNSMTLRCSCSQESISYSKFIELSPKFHQICSSDFISPVWFNRLILNDIQKLELAAIDWLSLGASYFQLLASFCSLSETTIKDQYEEFLSNEFISAAVLPKSVFIKQIQRFVDDHMHMTRIEFNRATTLVRQSIYINQFVNDLSTSGTYTIDKFNEIHTEEGILSLLNPEEPEILTSPCPCVVLENQCGGYARFSDPSSPTNYTFVTDLFLRCSPIESVFSSTLNCWFKENCLYLVRSAFNISMNILPLNSNITSRFSRNSTIEMLIKELFLEDWSVSISYEKFFETCAPKTCFYTFDERFNMERVIVGLLSIFSGLNRGLRILIPILIRLILVLQRLYRRNREISPLNTSINRRTSFNLKMKRIFAYFRQLNIYKTFRSSTETENRERWSTRFYLIVLISVVVVSLFWTSFLERVESRTIMEPNRTTYESLVNDFSIENLQCPCSKISMEQNEFLSNLKVEFHPVCSSALVSSDWIEYLKGRSGWDPPNLILKDFRRWGLLFFRALTLLCSTANSSFLQSIDDFRSKLFISGQVLSMNIFQMQINKSIEQFEMATLHTFFTILETIRLASDSGSSITILGTNWLPSLVNGDRRKPLEIRPVVYDGTRCSCATSTHCFRETSFYHWNKTSFYNVIGIRQACTPLDSVFTSTLECFFSNSCLTEFLRSVPLGTDNNAWNDQIFPMSTLTFSLSKSKFHPNDPIEKLVEFLFIDFWSIDISYDNYFRSCSPLFCSYSFRRRFDSLFVLTSFLSVYSGLTIALRFAAPHLIKFICLIKQKLTNKY